MTGPCRALLIATTVFVTSLPVSLAAQVGVPTIVYDHFGTNANRAFDIEVGAGSFFRVRIDHTCKGDFDYTYYGIEPGARPQPRTGRTNAQCQANDSEPLTIPHDSRFRGYLVEIQPKNSDLQWLALDQQPPCTKPSDKCKKVENKIVLTVSVNSPGWTYELSGGGVISRLTDPEFAVVPRTIDEVEKMVVIRDREAEDESRLGFAGFVHVFHPRLRHLAGTFGMGINDGGKDLSFFLGPSWRLGGKGFLTAGWNWGPIQRLPNGISLGQPVSDSTFLNNLPTRTERRFFLGFSFSFLSPGTDFFKKPFATPANNGSNQGTKGGKAEEPSGQASLGSIADPGTVQARARRAPAHPAEPGNHPDLGLASLTARSEVCFRGRLLGKEAERLPDSKLIVTHNRFQVLEVLKGDLNDNEIILRTLGGTLGETTLKVSHIPEFIEGWEYVIFAKSSATSYTPVVGGTNGVFVVSRPSGDVYTYGLRSVLGESGGELELGSPLEDSASLQPRRVQNEPEVYGGRVIGGSLSILSTTIRPPWKLEDLRQAIRRHND